MRSESASPASLPEGESAQALSEFALAFPLQLFLVFGILQLALLMNATVVVDLASYRCARSALVGEHLEDLGDGRTGVEVVAQTLLAPLAGRALDPGDDLPEMAHIPGWGNGDLQRSDYAAAKTYVRIDEEGTGAAGEVTATVEYNHQLVFPAVDALFRLFFARDRSYPDDEAPRFAFGDEDESFDSLDDKESLIEPDSGRGRIRVIGGRTHYVITRSCTLYRSEPLE